MPRADFDSVGRPLIVSQFQSEALPDFDRTVPDGVIWRIEAIFMSFTTSAVVGNRQFEILLEDTDDRVFIALDSPVVHIASVLANYLYAPGLPDDNAFVVGFQSHNVLRQPWGVFPMSVSSLTAGRASRIRIRDIAGIDAAGDVMFGMLDVREYDGPDPIV